MGERCRDVLYLKRWKVSFRLICSTENQPNYFFQEMANPTRHKKKLFDLGGSRDQTTERRSQATVDRYRVYSVVYLNPPRQIEMALNLLTTYTS